MKGSGAWCGGESEAGEEQLILTDVHWDEGAVVGEGESGVVGEVGPGVGIFSFIFNMKSDKCYW